MIIQNGTALFSQYIRSRPTRIENKANQGEMQTTVAVIQSEDGPESFKSFEGQTEKDYRFECCAKHLSTASGIFKEAVDRCVDNGFDHGVREKVREAMDALNSMEADLKVMNGIPEIAPDVRLLESGQRQLRKAMWPSKLETTGLGNKEQDLQNLEATLKWVRLLRDKAYELSEKHQGSTCHKVI
jgi:hypothetical protein